MADFGWSTQGPTQDEEGTIEIETAEFQELLDTLPHREPELSDIDMLRREHEALCLVLDERFRILDELVETNEQNNAMLITAYMETTTMLDAVIQAIEKIDPDIYKAFEEFVTENRKKMIQIMEQVNGVVPEPEGTGTEGPLEDVAEQD